MPDPLDGCYPICAGTSFDPAGVRLECELLRGIWLRWRRSCDRC